MNKNNSEFERFLNKYFKTLDESLIVSYDVQKLKKELYFKFSHEKIVSINIDLSPSNNYETNKNRTGTPATLNLIVKDFKRNDLEQFNKILTFFGYFVAVESKEGNYIGYQIEPKYGVVFEPRCWGIDKMFHITPSSNVDNILSNGLLYGPSQTHFDHPGDRVFLFWTKSPQILQAWAKRLGISKNTNHTSILEIELKPDNSNIQISTRNCRFSRF